MLVLSAMLLAGCGDEKTKTNNAYVAATDKVVQSFNSDFQALQTDFTPVSTPDQDLTTLSSLQATVDRAAAALQKIDPPKAIATLHTALVAHVRGYDAVIDTAKTGFAAKSPTAVAAARKAFSASLAAVGTQIMATINTINGKLR